MFHAGDVTPRSVFLLQLLTLPGGDLGMLFEELDPPVKWGLSGFSDGGRDSGLKVTEPLLLVVLPLLRPYPGLGDFGPLKLLSVPAPVEVGLSGPPPRRGPMVAGK